MPLTQATARTVSVDALADFYLRCKHAYFYTDAPLVDDDTFDAIEAVFRERAPKHAALRVTGAAGVVAPGGKCALPYWMGSQDKVYPDKAGATAFASWRKFVAAHYDGDVPCSATVKLDGLSAILVVTAAGAQLLSRGDGTTAQDWSHHLPHLTTLRQPIAKLRRTVRDGRVPGARLVLRAEAIMSRAAFRQHQAAHQWTKTPRNVVSGLLNAKHSDPALLALVHLVAYEVVEPSGLVPTDQLAFLDKHAVTNVGTSLGAPCRAVHLVPAFTLAELEPLFWRFRERSPYDTDGVVVTVDCPYARNTKDNPKYAFAFKIKVNDATQVGETDVVGVEWNVSRHGQWKPTILVSPVVVGGVTIQRATGFHAKFVAEQHVGPGARVRIRRCGDVIPNVVAVLRPGTPASPPKGTFQWGDTRVDLVLHPPCPPVWERLHLGGTASVRAAHFACRTEQLAHFLKTLHVHSASSKTVAKFVDHGYTDPFALLAVDAATVSAWDGFAPKSSAALVAGFATCRDQPAPKWIVAADAFGRGFAERKLTAVVGAVPELLRADPLTKHQAGALRTLLLAAPGCQARTADALLAAHPGYVAYWKRVRAFVGTDVVWAVSAPTTTAPVATDGPMRGKVVRFTGFRDDALAAKLRAQGAEVVSGTPKRLNTVVWSAEKGPMSAKVKRMQAEGMTVWERGAVFVG